MRIKEILKNKKYLLIILLSLIAVLFLCVLCNYFIFKAFFTESESPNDSKVTTEIDHLDISITKPTSREWYVTTEPEISLGGIVSGGDQLTVDLTVNGQSYEVEVTDNNWNSEIFLTEGDNEILIQTKDPSGSLSDQMTIVYASEINTGELIIDPQYLSPGSVENVYFSITINSESNLKPFLYQVDQVGSLEGSKEIAEMFDDGEPIHGDAIKGDGIYSVKMEMSVEELADLNFRVASKEPELRFINALATLPVYVEPTEVNYDKFIKDMDIIRSEYQSIREVTEGEDTNTVIAKSLSGWLQDQDFISEAGISDNGTGVWWEMKESGILGGISQTNNDMRAEKSGFLENLVRPVNAQEETTSIKTEVGNHKAIYLGPYYSTFVPYDDYDFAVDEIKRSSCPNYEIKEDKEKEVTVDDFKTLDQYGLIVISSHGDTWYNNQLGVRSGYVVVHTDEVMSLEKYIENYPDLKAKRLAVRLRPDGYYFTILPQFVERYNGGMPNSVVYMGSCRSAYNSTMAAAFLGAGAKAYYGFSEYVHSGYAYNSSGNLFNKFIAGNETAYEAYLSALRAAGSKDGANPANRNLPPAEFLMYGEKDLTEKEDPCCDGSCISGTYEGSGVLEDTNKTKVNHVAQIDITVTVDEDGASTGSVNIVEPEYNLVLDPENPDPLIVNTCSAYGSGTFSGEWDPEAGLLNYAPRVNGEDVANEVENGDYFSIDMDGEGNYTSDCAKSGTSTSKPYVSVSGAIGSEKMHVFLDFGQVIQYRMWLEKVD